jgi:hypothetical protein
LCLAFVLVGVGPAQQAKPKAYNLPAVDLKQQVIWGATCDGPDGTGLAFGGQDQKSYEGIGRTAIKVNGEWKVIHEELREHNPFRKAALSPPLAWVDQREDLSLARYVFFQHGASSESVRRAIWKLPTGENLVMGQISGAIRQLETEMPKLGEYELGQAQAALRELQASLKQVKETKESLPQGISSDTIKKMADVLLRLQQCEELLDAEPPPRALSPIAHDTKSKLYVIFGGDHLDYLMNDTWVFDMAKKKWEQRHPKTAPPPRANHTLKATGDGKIVLSGGYTYTSNTDYVGGQYRDHNDGDWTYDIEANTWTGAGKAVEPNQRVYRTGPFHPDFYLQGDKPEAKPTQEKLAALPANTWVSLKPPHLPRLNRDWGTAVLDPDRDLILRFSGGHSAHGGTDVLHYHIATNRWELSFPVEFPLGQLYSNTSYPEGFNFNRRPWVTGHTYQNYGYDALSKKMYFTGRGDGHCYVYDPDVADWTGRFDKPKAMNYGSCFYTLTLTPTPQGLVCWTQQGAIFRLDPAKKEWVELKLQGKLPGAVVDNSTVIYDSKRDRLLCAVKGYGDKAKYDGKLHVVDLKTLAVSTLMPKGSDAATAIPYLCQIRYDSSNDLLLVGGTLPPDETGLRRTPAYDPVEDRWVSLKISGDDPSGKNGRNVSLGMMYDIKRKLFWAVDTNSNVFVLRLDPKTADLQPLK